MKLSGYNLVPVVIWICFALPCAASAVPEETETTRNDTSGPDRLQEQIKQMTQWLRERKESLSTSVKTLLKNDNVAPPPEDEDTRRAREAKEAEKIHDRLNRETPKKDEEDLVGRLAMWSQEERDKLQAMVEGKIHQTNVFFGTAFAIFAFLIFVLLVKFMFNIFAGILGFARDKIYGLVGHEKKSLVPERYLGPTITSNRRAAGKNKTKRSRGRGPGK